MDGNGRWAKKRALPRSFGHKAGVKAVKDIVKAANVLGVRFLTLYAFSTENWKRPKKEIKLLFSLISNFLKKELEQLNRAGVVLRILGDLSKFDKKLKSEIENACEITSKNSGLQLNIALNYGARQEILQAFNKMLKDGVAEASEENLPEFLYTKGQPDPDLLIRTSGEFRISNFLLWQIAYTEIYITDKLWPDFKKQDLEKAIDEFNRRKRRFGGI
jgi:undecaprenyl diphosphate synthase